MTDEYVPDDAALHTPEAERAWHVIRSISAAGVRRFAEEEARARRVVAETVSLGSCRKHQTFFRAGTMCLFCERDEEGM